MMKHPYSLAVPESVKSFANIPIKLSVFTINFFQCRDAEARRRAPIEHDPEI